MNKAVANEGMEYSNAAIAPEPKNCDIVSQFSRDFWVDKDKIAALTDAEVVKRYLDAKRIGTAAREVRIAFFEDMQRRFKTYDKKRNGVPTLESAFSDHGMNYDTERQAVYREKKRLLEDLEPTATTQDKKTLSQLADGAEVINKANGHPVTVEHDNVTTNNVLGDETVAEGEPPVRKEYKRGDLCTMAEWLEQADKTDKKKNRIDQKAANTAILADLALQLIGLLCNAPADATPDIIIRTAQQTAQLAYESLDAEQAQRITIPKLVTKFVKQQTTLQTELDNAKIRIGNLQEELADQKAVIKELKAANKTLSAAGRAKHFYKVGDDSRSLGIGTKNDLRAQGKRRHDMVTPTAACKSYYVRRIGDTADFGLFLTSAVEFTTATAVQINTDIKLLEAERDRLNTKYTLLQNPPDATAASASESL